MTVVRIKGLKSYTHPKTGKLYTYHRATGTRLKAEPGTPAFLAEVAALDAKTPTPKTAVPGTIGMVIAAYRKSPAWADLKPATRTSYDRAFDAIKGIEAMPLVDLDRPFIFGLQERIFRKRGRWMANYVVTCLSILFEYAQNFGWMKSNPADGVKRLKPDRTKPTQNRPWSREETTAVLSALAPYMRVPVALAMFAGLRKSDVLSVTKAAIKDGMIQVTTSKRNVQVTVPMHPELMSIIAAAPRHDAVTIAAN